MKALIVGDTHGNADWLRRYLYPVALSVQADAVVVLGDFGAWEHTPAGVAFMDECDSIAKTAQVPLYWLHGNHDKHSHTIAAYEPDQRGFLLCRDYVFYIPQGHVWMWGGARLRSFGGAYSVDKDWRIEQENIRYMRNLREAQQHKQAGGGPVEVEPTAGTLWFPEEEMTDNEMDTLLAADSELKDVVFSHDKPYSARPDWNRKDFTECLPNQMRLERALRAHRPRFWLHGHLHYFYTSDVTHPDGLWTTVVGLEPDDIAAEPGWRAEDTWAVLTLNKGQTRLKFGRDIHLDAELLQSNVALLD